MSLRLTSTKVTRANTVSIDTCTVITFSTLCYRNKLEQCKYFVRSFFVLSRWVKSGCIIPLQIPKKCLVLLVDDDDHNNNNNDNNRHRGEGGAGGGTLAPPLFWLIKLLFQFFSKVLHKKVHRVILCQTCGPQRKHCFFLIASFQSNIVFWWFSWCLSRQRVRL